MSSWDEWGWMHLIGVLSGWREGEGALHSFPKRAVLAGRLTACLSTWYGDWVWAVSFPLCLWNLGSCIFITCASVLGCYHRDRDKQNIKFKCLKILGLGSEDCAGLAPGLPTGVAQSPSCTRWKKSTRNESDGSVSWQPRGRGVENKAKASSLDYVSQMCCDITWM